MIRLQSVATTSALTRGFFTRSMFARRAYSSDKDITYVDLKNLDESPESAAAASHFFEFQTGRFLKNDREERRKRATKFDFKGLLKLLENKVNVAESGVSIETLEPLFEGKSNKLYKIVLKDQRSYVLRIPYNIGSKEYRDFRLLSEVATMEYINQVSFKDHPKFRATLPLAYSSSADNEIKTPYILSSFVAGEKFAAQWKPWETDVEQKTPVIEPIAEMGAQILKSKFPGYGSIYFAKDLPSNIKSIKIDDEFVLGPSVERKFWASQQDGASKLWGPWSSWSEYLQATADAQLEHARSVSGEASANFRAAERYAKIVPKLFSVTEMHGQIASPRLCDPDLSPLNVISQDGEKFWLIDVENSVVKPYVFHGVPWFVRNPGERIYRLEDVPNYEQLPEQQKSIVKHFYSLTQSEVAYEKLLKQLVPDLIYAHHPNLKRREELVNRAMITDINTGFFNDLDYAMFRLMELWPMLRTGVEPPVTYADTEINELAQSIAQWNQDLMRNKYLESDGYVPAEEFDQLLGTGNLKVLDDKIGNYELTEEFLDSQDMMKNMQ